MVFGDDPTPGLRARPQLRSSQASASASRCRRASSSTTPATRCWRPAPTARRSASTRSVWPQGTDLADYLKSGWVNGLDEASVQSFSVNGMQAASAAAKAKGWVFQIARRSRPAAAATYRFIFANETGHAGLHERGAARRSAASARSHRRRSPSLKALHIHVVTAAAGDTEAIAGAAHARRRPAARPLPRAQRPRRPARRSRPARSSRSSTIARIRRS